MENLAKFIALEKLLKDVGHGSVNLKFQLRDGKIVGITTRGVKKTLYNSSEKDININQVALEYIVRRISQQLESQVNSELVFKVSNISSKIKSVEVESEQTIK